MSIPHRGRTSLNTYFVTFGCYCKKRLFQSEQVASLLLEVLQHYRATGQFALHAFVIMPDHVHLLLTPHTSLERCIQLIKGGFSFRNKRELGFGGEVWQTSFVDRRVRDSEELENFRRYTHDNPVRAGLASAATDYRWSSAARTDVDDIPPRLKPLEVGAP